MGLAKCSVWLYSLFFIIIFVGMNFIKQIDIFRVFFCNIFCMASFFTSPPAVTRLTVYRGPHINSEVLCNKTRSKRFSKESRNMCKTISFTVMPDVFYILRVSFSCVPFVFYPFFSPVFPVCYLCPVRLFFFGRNMLCVQSVLCVLCVSCVLCVLHVLSFLFLLFFILRPPSKLRSMRPVLLFLLRPVCAPVVSVRPKISWILCPVRPEYSLRIWRCLVGPLSGYSALNSCHVSPQCKARAVRVWFKLIKLTNGR